MTMISWTYQLGLAAISLVIRHKKPKKCKKTRNSLVNNFCLLTFAHPKMYPLLRIRDVETRQGSRASLNAALASSTMNQH